MAETPPIQTALIDPPASAVPRTITRLVRPSLWTSGVPIVSVETTELLFHNTGGPVPWVSLPAAWTPLPGREWSYTFPAEPTVSYRYTYQATFDAVRNGQPVTEKTGRISYAVLPVYPVTPELAAQHLLIPELESRREYVRSLIAAATDYAEQATQSTLAARNLTATFESPADPMPLRRGPVTAIVSVTDAAGEEVPGDHRLLTVGRMAYAALVGSPAFPVTVTYRAGYELPDEVPAGIRHAVLMHVGTLYESRESTTDKPKTPVPHTLDDFYRLHGRGTGVA
ncbi:MAG: hypothetical protein JWO31_3645 [Phycisphaerales bacterium]|nr:hypothetical protein [Phycisphaerales bacterium]